MSAAFLYQYSLVTGAELAIEDFAPRLLELAADVPIVPASRAAIALVVAGGRRRRTATRSCDRG